MTTKLVNRLVFGSLLLAAVLATNLGELAVCSAAAGEVDAQSDARAASPSRRPKGWHDCPEVDWERCGGFCVGLDPRCPDEFFPALGECRFEASIRCRPVERKYENRICCITEDGEIDYDCVVYSGCGPGPPRVPEWCECLQDRHEGRPDGVWSGHNDPSERPVWGCVSGVFEDGEYLCVITR